VAGKFEVKGVLGEGGSGVVYDAVRKDDGVAVALKVVHPHLAGDKQIRGRFVREAAILRRLEGRHICPVLETGEVSGADATAGLLYMALPKLEGRSLEQLMKAGLVDVDRALDIMLEVCEALRSAHAQGVIHRDLKPANVILVAAPRSGIADAEPPKAGRVVVVDFGLAKIVTGAGTGTTNLTTHNMLFGTPEYMSPEQARGDELDVRCDVYAAGVMLYELLTGAPPFGGPTPLSVLTAHLTSDLEPPSRRVKDGRVTKALESVVMHALARDREERYPSASALGAAIMHARSRPDDVVSLRPEAFATNPHGTDAFAVTMPAISGPARTGSSPRVVVSDSPASGRTSDARATKPSAAMPRPASKPPPSGGAGRGSSPSSPSKPMAAKEATSRAWVVVWVVAAVASIGLGVYFALR
jgi:serine/threonine-protein kinase